MVPFKVIQRDGAETEVVDQETALEILRHSTSHLMALAVLHLYPDVKLGIGPATSDVMRTWVVEGRVGPDSLVWQEGWRDWQQAADVFPALGSGQQESDLGPTGGVEGGSAGAATGGFHAPTRGRSVVLNVAIVTVLVLAVVVLLGIFLWVLQRGPEPQGDASTQAPTRVASALHCALADRSVPAGSGHDGARRLTPLA